MAAYVGIVGVALSVAWPFGLLLWLIELRNRPRHDAGADDAVHWLAARRKVTSVRRRIPDVPPPPQSLWPIAVIRLAEALTNGADCAFALHDALLEAGHDDLARQVREQPEADQAIARMILTQQA
jgi:hypothetical protein